MCPTGVLYSTINIVPISSRTAVQQHHEHIDFESNNLASLALRIVHAGGGKVHKNEEFTMKIAIQFKMLSDEHPQPPCFTNEARTKSHVIILLHTTMIMSIPKRRYKKGIQV